jgi:hypothetical protein
LSIVKRPRGGVFAFVAATYMQKSRHDGKGSRQPLLIRHGVL